MFRLYPRPRFDESSRGIPAGEIPAEFDRIEGRLTFLMICRVATVRRFPLPGWVLLGQLLFSLGLHGAQRVDFNRDVRPILSDHCFACHGFDEAKRKGGLRLDVKEEAMRGGKSGKPAIQPNRAADSELVRRIVTADADDHMPPAEFGKPLTAAQVAVLRQWVEEGAEFKGHWAFQTPQRPMPPKVRTSDWPRNAIDQFVLSRLEEKGLQPQPRAEKSTLIRRATLDLTGLPPTPEEVDRFLADESPEAYEKVVDRLLGSARYGERMALEWMDAARFADTHGYHIDSARDMTAWRDGVIDSFNRNQPFDQFTVEQLAGDLLPNATRAQKIASGFNRNHMINYEGGAIPEEYQTAYVLDRINTTATVWLGLTMACAQCHDHKYDPLTMRDYYRFYAFFNAVPENGLDGRNGNAAPMVAIPTEEQEARLAELERAAKEADQRLKDPLPEVDAQQVEWERNLNSPETTSPWKPLDWVEYKSAGGATLELQPDRSLLASGENPPKETYTFRVRSGLSEVTGFRLEAMADDRLPAKGPGRFSNGNAVLTDVRVEAGGPVKIRAATADFSQAEHPIKNAIDDRKETGWAIMPQVGRGHEAIFEFEKPLQLASGGGKFVVILEFQSTFAQHTLGRVRLSATGLREPSRWQPVPEAIRTIAGLPNDVRTEAQRTTLRDHFRKEVSSTYRALRESSEVARRNRDQFQKSIRSSMVMGEQPEPRPTFMLVRGDYDKKGEKVTAGTPAALPTLREGLPANRLGLARWLVSPEQPLTARVTVNRFWQQYFGLGLVKSAENFGSQGDWPTHPELLDWLAVEFMESGWDVKALQKRIVMSATYQQSSAGPRELIESDPENHLLARGPRFRLHAEFVRDLALSVSGLLNPMVGGESVFPYQPAGLWEELMSRQDGDNFTAQKYSQDRGQKLYRRSMYTFVKRTSAHPNMTTFDAPDRQVCTVRRPRTNTPLQALVLLNDPTYVEAARKLAERVVLADVDERRRVAHAFRLATGRLPREAETQVLLKLYREQLAAFRANPSGAEGLLRVGESPVTNGLDPVELAAWAVVASTILNLDETITKG